MENAADALKIAAAILIFIIAIASSFSLFGVAKHTADSIITMRDRQSYLEAAELDGGILYTSATSIKGTNEELTETEKQEESSIGGVTKNGDRIVGMEDVISTIYRYSIEKYGVTIVSKTGKVIARYDSSTEQIMTNWHRVDRGKYEAYALELADNTKTDYASPIFSGGKLENLYGIGILDKNPDGTDFYRFSIGAPWYGNDIEIQKRIACDLKGTDYIYNNQKYKGKNLINELKGRRIVEVTNEIDNSTYLKQTDENGNPILDENGNPLNSNLLQSYTMPTIEIVYIILD